MIYKREIKAVVEYDLDLTIDYLTDPEGEEQIIPPLTDRQRQRARMAIVKLIDSQIDSFDQPLIVDYNETREFWHYEPRDALEIAIAGIAGIPADEYLAKREIANEEDRRILAEMMAENEAMMVERCEACGE